MNVTDFERRYAERSGVALDELHKWGYFGAPCDCGEDICEGFQMARPDLTCLECGHYLFQHGDEGCPFGDAQVVTFDGERGSGPR